MATNGQLLRRLAEGNKLLESEIQQLERALDGYDNYSDILKNNTAVGGKELQISLPFNIIYSTILDTDTASLEIPIPGAYKHLIVFGQARGTGSGGGGYIFLTFNGDTGANYMNDTLYQIGANHGGSESLSNSNIPIVVVPVDDNPENHNGSFVVFIPHYNSAYYKTVLMLDASYTNNTRVEITQGIWKNVGQIKSIKFFPDAYTLKTGSLFSVYGVM